MGLNNNATSRILVNPINNFKFEFLVIGRRLTIVLILHCNVIDSMPDVYICYDYRYCTSGVVQFFINILVIVDYTHF